MNMKRLVPVVVVAACLIAAGCEPEIGPNGIPVVGEGPLECGRVAAQIHVVQGNQAMSPVVGEVVEVEGRISAKFIDGLGGFFLRSESGQDDQDPVSSEGIFVRHPEPLDWPVGSLVRVRATVAELGPAPDTQTALIEIGALVRCPGKAVVPEARPVVAAGSEPTDWERFEGERIAVAGPLSLVGNDDLLRHGSLIVSFDGRDFTPTERHIPGQDARALAAANLATQLVLDDARLDEFPKQLWHLPMPLSPDATYRVDSQIGGIDGVMEQRDGEYRVQLVAPLGSVTHAPRPPKPPDVDGDVRVGSFNVLNYFNGDGAGGGFPTPRGAQSLASFKRQSAKIVAALDLLDADIVALMEIENDGYGDTSAVADLVRQLNAARGKERGDYTYVRPDVERIGEDPIAVALIYRQSRVQARGAPAFTLQGPFAKWSRPPLAQRFVAGELDVVVVANHFKSKGCQDAAGPDQNQEDGQGCFNATRVDSARTLAEWLAGDPLAAGHDRVLLVGDLNAYGNEDPLRHLLSRDYVDVVAEHNSEPAYSYVFRGASGRLDHALASTSLAAHVGGAGEWHINADESPGFEYDEPDYDRRALKSRYRPDVYRSSDHDPLLLGLRVKPQVVPPAAAN
ncbi:MAG TPA: ExeM/NucH family extracellular endonuclease [Patescibacteria group bacterium]|nr:ExeM/NucH family extracellular endonuclease [Patescibacteria group bacterium]